MVEGPDETVSEELQQPLLTSSLFLPSFEHADPGFKASLTGRLLHTCGMHDLESRGTINWAVDSNRLTERCRVQPMWTLSDGNCLLHASLLGIWGLHDTGTVNGLSPLRAAMCRVLADPRTSTWLKQRFLAKNNRENSAQGFEWDVAQADAEWARIL